MISWSRLAALFLLSLIAACGGSEAPSDGSTEPEGSSEPSGRITFHSSRAGGNTDVYVMQADGTGVSGVTAGPDFDQSPSWSPDGAKIAFARVGGGGVGDIFVVNADGTGETSLTDDQSSSDPAWSPDGAKIAFATDRDGQSEIYVMNADGTDATNITNDPGDDFSPSWSPDGTRIAFTSYRGDDSEIFVVNADGTGLSQLTDNKAEDSSPSWSPDGTRIVFESDRDAPPPEIEPGSITITILNDLYLMNEDGTGQTRLTQRIDQGGASEPTWSPDGSWIAFSLGSLATNGIAIVRPDGTDLRVLVESASGTADGSPDWVDA